MKFPSENSHDLHDLIKVAIVGLGRIASLLEEDTLREKPCTHAGAVAANAGCALAAGCDHEKERRNLFSERWGVPVFASAEEMLTEYNPRIFIVATHPDSHYRYCRLAAERGVPVIICEKPLADTLSAARKIAALERQYPSVIITNHERRYSADYIKAKAILKSGKLGALLSVRAVLYMGKNKRLLDVFWHDGTHLADVIMFLSGAVLKHRKRWGVKLSSRSGTAWLEGELRQPDAAAIPVIMEIGAGRDHLVFEMEFSCANGRLRIGNGVFEVWESGESPYAQKFKSLFKTEEGFRGTTGYFSNMLADAVNCVCTPGHKPVSSASCGLAVIEYLHSVKAWR